jgi:hypothetical protein
VFKWLTVAAALGVAAPLALLLLVVATTPAAGQASTNLAGSPSVTALNSIPPAYLTLYLAAARTCPGLPWSVLAGIGKVESDHGQSNAPGVRSGANYAGAEGPMQFEPATFARYAVNAGKPAPLTPYDPADAIYTADAQAHPAPTGQLHDAPAVPRLNPSSAGTDPRSGPHHHPPEDQCPAEARVLPLLPAAPKMRSKERSRPTGQIDL